MFSRFIQQLFLHYSIIRVSDHETIWSTTENSVLIVLTQHMYLENIILKTKFNKEKTVCIVADDRVANWRITR